MEIDYGHYIDTPIPSGDGVVTLREGEALDGLFIIHKNGEALPYNTVVAADGSSVNICVIILPGVDMEIPLYIDLAGENASANLSGVYLCSGKENVTFRTKVLHRAGHCNSNQLFNGIAGGESHANFYGTIVVAPDAQKTEAYQSNHNMIVSDKAKVDTKPQLEIYADDVKCSHGATIGSLNADEQFYMRSRGIPEEEAKVFQMISFIAPVLERINDPGKREEVAAEIEKHIRAI